MTTRTIQVHPFSVALGALVVLGASLLVGWSKGDPHPLNYMSVVQIDDGFGNMIDTVRFTGCNVQVVNGLGETGTINGAGNLIVGYNEAIQGGGPDLDRSGSHNIVGGEWNNYSSYGGLIVGRLNTISARYASVTGGEGNAASGHFASVSGGIGNVASGSACSVSGGSQNAANGTQCSVSGGGRNTATGILCSVSGGGGYKASIGNTASGLLSSVSGGSGNNASGHKSSVGGGSGNVASMIESSISGGCNQITDPYQHCQHLPTFADPCPPDTNADAVIDFHDLLAVLSTWGPCPQ